MTWATYGTWLPGNSRGWVEYRHGWQLADPALELEAAVGFGMKMTSPRRSSTCRKDKGNGPRTAETESSPHSGPACGSPALTRRVTIGPRRRPVGPAVGLCIPGGINRTARVVPLPHLRYSPPRTRREHEGVGSTVRVAEFFVFFVLFVVVSSRAIPFARGSKASQAGELICPKNGSGLARRLPVTTWSMGLTIGGSDCASAARIYMK